MGNSPLWKRVVTQTKVPPLLTEALSILTREMEFDNSKHWWPELEEDSLATLAVGELARARQSRPNLLATTPPHPWYQSSK